MFRLTFMTVGASETLLTLARKLAPGLASAAPVRPTDVGGDVSHPVRRTVGCHGNSAAVNHCQGFNERTKYSC